MNDDDIAAVMEILWESSEAKAQEVLNYTKGRAERLAALVAPLISEARTDALESRPMTADREAVETVVGRVLWNAANFPERAQPGMLGANIMPLTNLVTDAVMAVLRPVADAQAEALEYAGSAAQDELIYPSANSVSAWLLARAADIRTPASPTALEAPHE